MFPEAKVRVSSNKTHQLLPLGQSLNHKHVKNITINNESTKTYFTKIPEPKLFNFLALK